MVGFTTYIYIKSCLHDHHVAVKFDCDELQSTKDMSNVIKIKLKWFGLFEQTLTLRDVPE